MREHHTQRRQPPPSLATVLGYVIMRVALVFQWLRGARQDHARRRACLTYALVVSIAQVGWVVLIVLHFSIARTLVLS